RLIYRCMVKPREKGAEQALKDITNFQSRDTDIMICTYAKSGTHWINEITSMLIRKTAELDNINKATTMLETISDFSVTDDLPSPRLLNTHSSLELGMSFSTCGCRQNVAFCKVHMDHGTLMKRVLNKQRKTILDMIFTCSYEEMKKDPKTEIRKLADFLEVQCTDKLIEDIAKATSFENMKENKIDFSKAVDGITHIYRKGIVGDWKNHFTVAQNEQFDAQYVEDRQRSNSLPYDFLFESTTMAFFHSNDHVGTHCINEIENVLMDHGRRLINSQVQTGPVEARFQVVSADYVIAARLLNTHCQFRYLPKGHIVQRGKIIHMIRNPKDTCASYYHHSRKDNIFLSFFGTWNEFFDLWMSAKCAYGSWYTYEKGIEQAEKDYPGMIFTCSYEEMKKDPKTEIRKLADFLEVQCTDKLIEDIAKATSFENMKEKKIDFSKAGDGTTFIYRKEKIKLFYVVSCMQGIVGDWKNHFTVAQNEQFDAQYVEEFRDCSYKSMFDLE
ncbi:Hypothetical predicted protein, partial [Mytilus galloprovincialis]